MVDASMGQCDLCGGMYVPAMGGTKHVNNCPNLRCGRCGSRVVAGACTARFEFCEARPLRGHEFERGAGRGATSGGLT
jgi:hypothetical protein